METVNSDDFADQVAALCYEKYTSLPKKGKPQASKEWTLLAAVVATHHSELDSKLNEYERIEVISLATGTKCLSESKLKSNGSVLHDSHAESIARRGFKRFLLAEIEQCLLSKSSRYIESIIDAGIQKFHLNPRVRLHLFTSHTPCGDASIFPKSSSDEAGIPSLKRKAGNETEHDRKRAKTDIHRTGAKCVPGGEQDECLGGDGYHLLALLRTKPGRGERTLSMSCSDKIAKWNILGIQGALLSIWMKAPLYLSSVIVGRCPYSEDAMKRALIDRISELDSCQLPPSFCLNKPRVLHASKHEFQHSKTIISEATDAPVASSAAVCWCLRGDNSELSVSVNGFKQGVTAKNVHKPFAWSPLCKFKMMQEFIRVSSLIPEDQRPMNFRGNVSSCSYQSLKMSSEVYQAAWQVAKTSVLSTWVSTPREMYNFSLKS